MTPGTRSNHESVNAATLSRKLKPVISQRNLAQLFIEANDLFWRPYDGLRYWAYDAQNKCWHKFQDSGSHIGHGYGSWCETDGEPWIDYRPAVFFDLVKVLDPLLETASPADQRRAGTYRFLSDTIKLLECHPSIVIQPRDLNDEPRPCWEEQQEEKRRAHHG